jgi:peptidoglycan/xylan/chitin deacetylase (PgdA/CDA1 family)
MKNSIIATAITPQIERSSLGVFPILEYHKFSPQEADFDRSYDNFRSDLEKLYQIGCRPATISEIIENRMGIPEGTTPVALTFDDSSECQFRMDSAGNIDPNCAIGIMMDFAKDHPDFPPKGTFYALPQTSYQRNGGFGDEKWLETKFQILQALGSEIGVHAISHQKLSRLSDEMVRTELALSVEWLRSYGIEPKTVCSPYGQVPKNPYLLKSFFWKGKHYQFNSHVITQGRAANSPESNNPESPYFLPRLKGGINYPLAIDEWIDLVEQGKIELYTPHYNSFWSSTKGTLKCS